LIGLELEREMYQENYRALKNAAVLFFGALGGMVVPQNFFTVKYGTITQNGAGIPMATDSNLILSLWESSSFAQSIFDRLL
jgi:NhaA family Na+:H+ antiporter